MDWFQLPGPAAFLDRIVRDIRAGKSVVVSGSGIGTRGVISAVRNSLNQDSLNWIVLASSSGSPLRELFNLFDPKRPLEAIPSLGRLFSLDGFHSAVIEVRIASAETWKHWISFMEEFAYFSRSQNELSRSQMIILVNREISQQLPRTDLLLSIYDTAELSTISDMRIYALCLAERRNGALIKKELAASISSELSLWDRSLCERLCVASLSALMSPRNILLGYARERGWVRPVASQDIEFLKKAGAIQRFIDKEEAHSALLAVQRDSLQINRRIWRGQTSILFPLIETRRLELLEKHRDIFDLPHHSPDGKVVNDYYDLDWGNICYQFKEKQPRIDNYTFQRALGFREARNALAHMELVPLGILDRLLSDNWAL